MTAVKGITCPHCGKFNDMHELIGGKGSPKPGDATLCIGCGKLAVFTEHGQRLPTSYEEACFRTDPVIRQAQRMWEMLFTVRGKPS